jgi:hypothetical protein
MLARLRNLPQWSKKLLVSLTTMLIIFLVFEVACRIAYDEDQPSYVLDDELIWTLEPGMRTKSIHVNSLGLRGPEIPAKDPTKARVYITGDSVTYGAGVKDDESLVAQLAASLANDGARRHGDPRPLELLNAGGPGWGIFQMVIAARRALDRFDPQVVVVLVSPVDLYRQPFPNEAEKQAYFKHYRRKILVHKASYFVTFLYRRFQLARYAPQHSQWGLATETHAIPNDTLWAADEALLRKLAADCAGHRTTLVLGVLDDLTKNYDWVAPKVKALAESLGVPFVDLGPAVAGRKPREMQVSDTDGHYNPMANGLAAKQLAAELYARGIIEKPAR